MEVSKKICNKNFSVSFFKSKTMYARKVFLLAISLSLIHVVLLTTYHLISNKKLQIQVRKVFIYY